MRTPVIAVFLLLNVWACDDASDETEVVSEVAVAIHPRVSTVLVVNWNQAKQSDNVWLRFTFENDEYFESPKRPGVEGEHEEVILGTPSETEVTFRVVTETGGEETESEDFFGTTGPLPTKMPRPTLVEYNPALASADRWNMGSVENTKSASTYYSSEFWLYILDRQARVVWYLRDPLDARILFPEIAADGTHIIYDATGYTGGVRVSKIHRATLDFGYETEIDMGDMNWDWAERPDGTIVYNTVDWGNVGASLLKLWERLPDGTLREIWDCAPWAETVGVQAECYSNTVNLSPLRDSVILSMPYLNTILEIERATGNILGQWGDAPGSWDFEPEGAGLEFNHFATITKDGTVLVSSHLPGGEGPGDHRIMEFEIDEENQTASEIWTWGEGVDVWPTFSGEATRMENGNTLLNLGSGGSIWEVTPDKQTAWHVLWDADFPDPEDNLLCGHNVFVNDLYALNRGPEE